jgi:hypothetical protein
MKFHQGHLVGAYEGANNRIIGGPWTATKMTDKTSSSQIAAVPVTAFRQPAVKFPDTREARLQSQRLEVTAG